MSLMMWLMKYQLSLMKCQQFMTVAIDEKIYGKKNNLRKLKI